MDGWMDPLLLMMMIGAWRKMRREGVKGGGACGKAARHRDGCGAAQAALRRPFDYGAGFLMSELVCLRASELASKLAS